MNHALKRAKHEHNRIAHYILTNHPGFTGNMKQNHYPSRYPSGLSPFPFCPTCYAETKASGLLALFRYTCTTQRQTAMSRSGKGSCDARLTFSLLINWNSLYLISMMTIGADDKLFLDSDCSTHDSGYESKPRPSAKKKHVDSKYQVACSYKYPMDHSNKGETFAFWKVCIVDFSVAGGGVHQIKRPSLTHISNANRARNCSHPAAQGAKRDIMCSVRPQ